MIYLILGMFLVTFLPRYLPFRFLDVNAIPAPLRRFLRCIPYAALGSLIFPQVFYSVGGNLLAGTIGALAAALIALFTKSVIATILTGVVVATLVITFI